MAFRAVKRPRAILESLILERRLYIRTKDWTRFIRLKSGTQLLAWTSSALFVGWGITATAVLLMDSIGSSSYRDQAGRDHAIYEGQLNTLISERDQRAAEALAAQERFGTVLEQISVMQSELLVTENLRLDMEAGLETTQVTLRRTMTEREDARANVVALGVEQPSRSGERSDLARTVDLLTVALAETAAERDEIGTTSEETIRLAGDLDLELRLMEERNDDIFGQIEDALTISVEPLDDVFRAAGLDPEALIEEVQGNHSAETNLVQIQVSTMGSSPADDATVRANRILDGLDRIDHYRVALERVPLAMPVRDTFRYTSPFGPRGGRMHEGTDMAGPVGTPIYATADGVVTFAGWENGYGRIIKVQHDFGIETRYPHLNAIRVDVGQAVARGEQVGDMGNSGRSTGPHLHYEVRVNGEAVDPMTYIRAGQELL